MGILDKLFGKKSKDSEVKDVGIKKGEVKKKSKQITTKKSKKFDRADTKNPDVAVEMLFDHMAAIPTLSHEKFVKAYDRMRQAWGPLPLLVEGPESEVKHLILKNAQAVARRATFDEFTVDVYVGKEYRGREAVQIMAWWRDRTGAPIGGAAHLWRTEDGIHAIGVPELLKQGKEGGAKAKRKNKKHPPVGIEKGEVKKKRTVKPKKKVPNKK